MIRDGKTHMLVNTIQTGMQFGMQSMEQALMRLASTGEVDTTEVKEILASHNIEPSPSLPSPPTERKAPTQRQSGVEQRRSKHYRYT